MNPTTWFIIALLVLGTALYVAAEFSVVAVRRSQIQSMAQEGNGAARKLLPILEDAHKLDRYIAACQIGITLSSLILGAFGQATLGRDLVPLLRDWAGMAEAAAVGTASLITLVVMTTLHMVFGELVPKSLALQFPARVALATLPPMRWSLVVLGWAIKFLNGSGIQLLKLMGVPQTGHRHIHSPDEIEMLIVDSSEGGLLQPDEQERLRGALRLSRRTARQLMVPRRLVEGIDVNITIEKLLERAESSSYTRLPVYEGTLGNIVGLIHTKDLVARFVESAAPNGGISSVRELMREVAAVPESLPADQLLSTMRERRARLAIVVDEHGGTSGIVTLEDLIRELLGDVGDEFKGAQPQPERLPDGRVRLPGLLPADEVEAWANIQLSGGAATVGGHVLMALGRVPRVGEVLEMQGVRIEVERVDAQAIASLLVTPAAPTAQPQLAPNAHGELPMEHSKA